MATELPKTKIEFLYELIMSLDIDEQRQLLHLLSEGGGGAGVREPRRPLRPSSSGAVALDPETEEWVAPGEWLDAWRGR
jgi:hypothetical protein